jgi:hypothetical protein
MLVNSLEPSHGGSFTGTWTSLFVGLVFQPLELKKPAGRLVKTHFAPLQITYENPKNIRCEPGGGRVCVRDRRAGTVV